ncbi:MAG TPA: DNA replication and repair protein RecF, partial [Candidatus Dormibacteraeota bacterium]|nr:DNA replication and repair protein RecF [Candidatus Dormibacteraeota bacterium]
AISLYAFRNYMKESVALEPGVNLFLGANAQGKTNLLEAIYLAATSRSPRASVLAEMVMWEQAGGRVVMEFGEGEQARAIEVRLERDPGTTRTRRTIRLDERPASPAKISGLVRTVLFHPEEMTLLRGSGEPRRRLVNGVLTQLDAAYAENLSRYTRLLEQRNQLLKRVAEDLEPVSALDWWTDELSRVGGEIMGRRAAFIEDIAGRISRRYAEVAPGEHLDVGYVPSFDPGDDAATAMAATLRGRQREELARGVTVAGPHRDDIEFRIGGLAAAAHASQGQQRTAILAFKLAEVEVLGLGGRAPVLLLDDVMSELDAPRRQHLLQLIEESPQSVITSAEARYFPDGFAARVNTREVEHGKVNPWNA